MSVAPSQTVSPPGEEIGQGAALSKLISLAIFLIKSFLEIH